MSLIGEKLILGDQLRLGLSKNNQKSKKEAKMIDCNNCNYQGPEMRLPIDPNQDPKTITYIDEYDTCPQCGSDDVEYYED